MANNKGDGGIYQAKDKNGKPIPNCWRISVSFGSAGGDRQRVQCTVRGTKAEAKKKRDEIRRQHEEGLAIDAGKVTVSEFIETWLEARQTTGKASETTIKNYRARLKTIEPYIGKKKLNKVTAAEIERAYAQLKAKKNLSGTTLNKLHVLLKSVFEKACDYDLILRNPCNKVESPSVDKPSARTIERDEIEIQRIEERFPRVKVRDLTPGRIEKVIAEMRAEGISENTIFKMVKKLRHVLSRPVQRGHLDRNPCDLVEGISEPKPNPVTKAHRRITEEDAAEFITWLYGQELNGKIVALWLGMTEHIRLGEALALRACDLDFEKNAIHIRGTLNKKCEIVPAKADSGRTLAMGSFLKGLLLAWIEIQKEQFPHMVKKWRRTKVPCGREWDETAPVCSSYYGTHINSDNYGRWMRSLMAERGLGEFTEREEWVDSRGIVHERLGGYVGPSYKSLRSFGATYLIGENVDVKTAQDHFGHKKSATTLELYAESVPKHEREVAKTMDSFVKTALGEEAPEEQSLEAFRDAITTQPPDEWPGWIRELAELASERLRSN